MLKCNFLIKPKLVFTKISIFEVQNYSFHIWFIFRLCWDAHPNITYCQHDYTIITPLRLKCFKTPYLIMTLFTPLLLYIIFNATFILHHLYRIFSFYNYHCCTTPNTNNTYTVEILYLFRISDIPYR